jgi:Beta-lactamase/short chain dehydrogenase
MAESAAPGLAVALIHQRRVAWAAGYGVADQARGQPVTPASRFQAASLSKPVTALGVLRLVEQGRIGLDDPVVGRLRRWRPPPSPPEDLLAAAGPRLQFPTSVCFAGDYRRTVHADRPSHLTRPGRGRGPCASAGADLARSELAGVIARLVEAFGRVDVLVNAAGTDMPGPVTELAVEDWDRVQAVTLRAPFVLSKAVLPHMQAAGNGTIVSVSSVAGKRGLGQCRRAGHTPSE